MKRLPLLVVLALLGLAIAVPMSGGMLGIGGASPVPASIAAGGTASTGPTGAASPAGTDTPPSPAPSASTDPAPAPETPAPLAEVAVVPATHFRAIASNTNRDEVARVLSGTSNRYEALVLVESEADAILSALGASRPADPERLVLASTAAALSK